MSLVFLQNCSYKKVYSIIAGKIVKKRPTGRSLLCGNCYYSSGQINGRL